jgi:hypothetical protein
MVVAFPVLASQTEVCNPTGYLARGTRAQLGLTTLIYVIACRAVFMSGIERITDQVSQAGVVARRTALDPQLP